MNLRLEILCTKSWLYQNARTSMMNACYIWIYTKYATSLTRNLSIYNIIRWFAWPMGLVNQAFDVPSIIFSFTKFFKILCKNQFNSICFFFLWNYKNKFKSFECPKSVGNYEKKILGTSDAWSISCLSHWPREPEYYIKNCRTSPLQQK